MAEHFGHRERHHPLIEELRTDLTRSYVDMMARLNGDLASELKRARGLSKGTPILAIFPGGQAEDANPLGIDLMKGHAPGSAALEKAQRKDPYGHTAYQRKDPRTGKMVRVEAKGAKPSEAGKPEKPAKGEEKKEQVKGAWYADEFGNVRYGTKPTPRFKRKLSDDEAKKVHQNLMAIINSLHGSAFNNLAKYMDVEDDTLDTLRMAASYAITKGTTPEEAFAELYTEGYEGATEDEAHELFANMMETFQQATESEDWKKKARALRDKEQEEAANAANTIKRQRRVVKGHFDEIVSGPQDSQAIKLMGLMYDLGLFFMPKSERQASQYTEDEDEARKLVGNVLLNPDRFNQLIRYADAADPEQQLALAVYRIIDNAADVYEEEEEEGEQEFWARLQRDPHEVGERLRQWLESTGKSYSDEEFKALMLRAAELSKIVKGHVDAKNREQGGDVFKALYHNQTDLKKLFANPKEVERLREVQAEHADRVVRALEAQENEKHAIDDAVLAGLRDMIREGGPKKGESKAEFEKRWKTADLLSHQKQAVGWMEAIDSGILAYDAGLGKTPISIAYISNMIKKGKIKRGVLVLPPNLIAQWPKEIERFRPGSKVQVISANYTPEERLAALKAINSGELEADFVIMTSSMYDTWSDEAEDKLQELAENYIATTGKKMKRTSDYYRVPKNLKAQWEEEHGRLGKRKLQELASEHVAAGNKLKREKGKFIIPKHLRAQWVEEHGIFENDELAKELKGLDGAYICDEVHAWGLKDPNNNTHIMLKHALEDKKHKFGMTATPMPNSPVDMFHLSNLFHPGSAGESAVKFQNKVINFRKEVDPETGKPVQIPIAADMKDMREAKKAIKPYVFMRRKSEKSILDEMERKDMPLPDIHPTSHALSLDPVSRAEYEACGKFGYDEKIEPMFERDPDYLTDKQMLQELTRRGYKAKTIETIMNNRLYIRKQKAAISPKLLNKNYKGPHPKIDHTLDIIRRHFADPGNHDKPVVIFSSFIDGLKLTRQELVKAGVPEHLIGEISGEVEQSERDLIQESVNSGKTKIVLIGIKAGGAGLNLQKKAYRNIFLDKPWTPADMEQAVGRTWRTGARPEGGKVHVHHMKITGTTDERKYDKLGSKVSTVDALAFADLGDEYIAGKVLESTKRLLGSFDDDVTEWSPEQKREALRLAGLSEKDPPPLPDIPALREHFDIKKFGKTLEEQNWKKFGDTVLKEEHTMNGVLHRAGIISDSIYQRRMRDVSKRAKQWMEQVGAAMDHPVAAYIGENFDYQSEAQQAVSPSKGTTPKQRKTSESKMPKVEKEAAKMPLPVSSRQLKVTPKTSITVKRGVEHPFKEDSVEHLIWQGLKSVKPKSMKEAVDGFAEWIYTQYNKRLDDKYTRAEAKAAAKKRITDTTLKKFHKLGLLELA